MEDSYGLWPLVIVISLFVIGLAWSFTRPKTSRDWRSLGAFSAFIVALFAEMYGFPLTIYLLSGWLTEKFPGMNIFNHNSGHMLENLFGFGGNPHFGVFHIASYILIAGGFILLSKAWAVLYKARQNRSLAATGPYARIRHPQYVGFVLIMFGFLFQWPTLITLLMFPILVFIYIWLARSEEKDSRKDFGTLWDEYAQKTPAFIPRLKKETVNAFGCGFGAALTLLAVYFIVLTLVSGWSFAQSQFATYWYFIISLTVGFGIQIALYQHIKSLAHNGQGMGKVVGVSGTTSTAAMISCCAHYLVNLAPILGVIGLVTFIAQYQVKLFWVGIFFNIAGIIFMANRISKLKNP